MESKEELSSASFGYQNIKWWKEAVDQIKIAINKFTRRRKLIEIKSEIIKWKWKRSEIVNFKNGFDKKRKVIVGQTSYKLRNKGKT